MHFSSSVKSRFPFVIVTIDAVKFFYIENRLQCGIIIIIFVPKVGL